MEHSWRKVSITFTFTASAWSSPPFTRNLWNCFLDQATVLMGIDRILGWHVVHAYHLQRNRQSLQKVDLSTTAHLLVFLVQHICYFFILGKNLKPFFCMVVILLRLWHVADTSASFWPTAARICAEAKINERGVRSGQAHAQHRGSRVSMENRSLRRRNITHMQSHESNLYPHRFIKIGFLNIENADSENAHSHNEGDVKIRGHVHSLIPTLVSHGAQRSLPKHRNLALFCKPHKQCHPTFSLSVPDASLLYSWVHSHEHPWFAPDKPALLSVKVK